MPCIWGVLMPHPPVIIPQVGRGRQKQAEKTLNGMQAVIETLRALNNSTSPQTIQEYSLQKSSSTSALADFMILLSPHQPYAMHNLLVNTAPSISGNLGRFGAPDAACTVHTPQEEMHSLIAHLQKNHIVIATSSIDNISNDHASIVPLLYLATCFPNQPLPPVIIMNPIGLSREKAYSLGKALAKFESNAKWGLVASGDLSHRLTIDAPGGFNPTGLVFDKAVVQALTQGTPTPLFNLTQKQIEDAGECGLKSVLTLLGLVAAPVEIFSYEGPFGVGYCTGLWQAADFPKHTGENDKAPQPALQEADMLKVNMAEHPENMHQTHPYVQLARDTVFHTLSHNNIEQEVLGKLPYNSELWSQRAGCFVSIKSKIGALRGCIGTIAPTQNNIGLEIVQNAIRAATQDYRFPPISLDELAKVVFSVDVLGFPESIRNIDELDPKKWGVIVSKNGKRGLLLPDLEGVCTVTQQLDITAQKAGLTSWRGAEIKRFSVTRYKEST